MKKTRFTETKIVSILKQHEGGVKVADICQEHGISPAAFHNWKAKYGGLDANQLHQLKELKAENAQELSERNPWGPNQFHISRSSF
ncbi:MAG: transposase [Bacteroidetes bacterium]|nr:transposase [Bacteroidota bacterium]